MTSGGSSGMGPSEESWVSRWSEASLSPSRTICIFRLLALKFSIRIVDKNILTVDQDEEICGQKEPRAFEFKSPKEFEEFVRLENQFEKDIESQLQGNKMPYR